MNPTNFNGISCSTSSLLGCLFLIIMSSSFDVGDTSYSTSYEHHLMRRLALFKGSSLSNDPSSASINSHLIVGDPLSGSRVYHAVAYGADPTGESDSSEALERALSDAFGSYSRDGGHLMEGVADLGGSQLHLDGGTYKISRPLRLPHVSAGNFMIHGGSLRASDSFPGDRHLIELWPSTPNSIKYEDITLKDLMLNSNFRGGGIAIINSLRTTVHNCYLSHFTTQGILIQGGHETYVTNSFIGQHINIGGDHREKDFTGIGVKIAGNDNALTEVVIFSAKIGVMVEGEANVLTGVHCYNKATPLGGTGIYVRAKYTRIVNCYLDFTGVVVEGPMHVHITGTFFLGNAFVVLKSMGGAASGVNIVDNMFSGDYTGVETVQLEGSFTIIDQVIVDRNNVRGMVGKATVGRGSVWGNGTSWSIDFSKTLLFPNLIRNVQYTLEHGVVGGLFPKHALRNVTENRVTVESDTAVAATLHVLVHQTM